MKTKAGKTDCMSSIPRTHTVEDNRLLKFRLCPPQVFIHNKYTQNMSIYLKEQKYNKKVCLEVYYDAYFVN